MVSPVSGNPTSSSPLSTAACTEAPWFLSEESSASTSRRSSASSPQAWSNNAVRCSGAHSAARWNNTSICAQRSGFNCHLQVLHGLAKVERGCGSRVHSWRNTGKITGGHDVHHHSLCLIMRKIEGNLLKPGDFLLQRGTQVMLLRSTPRSLPIVQDSLFTYLFRISC